MRCLESCFSDLRRSLPHSAVTGAASGDPVSGGTAIATLEAAGKAAADSGHAGIGEMGDRATVARGTRATGGIGVNNIGTTFAGGASSTGITAARLDRGPTVTATTETTKLR